MSELEQARGRLARTLEARDAFMKAYEHFTNSSGFEDALDWGPCWLFVRRALNEAKAAVYDLEREAGGRLEAGPTSSSP